MTFGRSGDEFLHDLLAFVHIDDVDKGHCIRCLPRQYHPCSVRARIVAHFVEIGHLAPAEATKVKKGSTCSCRTRPRLVPMTSASPWDGIA